MKLKYYLISLIIIGSSFLSQPVAAAGLSGKILLQVEERGEAWYVYPVDNKRYYLGSPSDAFAIMRRLGLGISNKDFYSFTIKMPSRLAGRIILKVEDKGQAYYVDPLTLKTSYLGRPFDAFQVIRSKGLGITNANLNKIVVGSLSGVVVGTPSTPTTPVAAVGEKIITYTWKYKNKIYTLNQTLKTSLYEQYQAAPKFLSYNPSSPPANFRDAFYSLFITPKSGDTSIDKLVSDLKSLAAAENFTADQTLEFIMAFIQYIPYDNSKLTNNQPNYLYETLYKNSGVCADKSFLGIAILKRLGYGAIMFDYPDVKHSAIGVACPIENSTHHSGYCYVETTNYFPIGTVPQEINTSGVAQSSSEQLDNVFNPASLGRVEEYQKTTGQVYNGITNTIDQVNIMKALKANISSSHQELLTMKSNLDAAKINVDSLRARLDDYQAAGDFNNYNKLVPEYNQVASDYNNQLSNYQLKIDIYNLYVQQYNSSLKDFFQN